MVMSQRRSAQGDAAKQLHILNDGCLVSGIKGLEKQLGIQPLISTCFDLCFQVSLGQECRVYLYYSTSIAGLQSHMPILWPLSKCLKHADAEALQGDIWQVAVEVIHTTNADWW